MAGLNKNSGVSDPSIPFLIVNKADSLNACRKVVRKLPYRLVHSIFIISRRPDYVKLYVFVDLSYQFEGLDEVMQSFASLRRSQCQ